MARAGLWPQGPGGRLQGGPVHQTRQVAAPVSKGVVPCNEAARDISGIVSRGQSCRGSPGPLGVVWNRVYHFGRVPSRQRPDGVTPAGLSEEHSLRGRWPQPYGGLGPLVESPPPLGSDRLGRGAVRIFRTLLRARPVLASQCRTVPGGRPTAHPGARKKAMRRTPTTHLQAETSQRDEGNHRRSKEPRTMGRPVVPQDSLRKVPSLA